MKKFLYIFIYLLFSIFLYSQNNFFWDKKDVFSTGNIGKIEVFRNSNLLGAVFSESLNIGDKENKSNYKLNIKYSQDRIKWSNKEIIIKEFYSNNEDGVDFSASIDSLNNLYLCYRSDEKKLIINKYNYSDGFKNIISSITIDSENIIYLPVLFISTTNLVHLAYSENTAKGVKLVYKIIQNDKISAPLYLGDNYKTPLNPAFQEVNGSIYVAFQAKDQPVNDAYFFQIALGKSMDNGKNWEYRTLVTPQAEHNQRPYIYIDRSYCYLVWEKDDDNYISHIYYKKFNIGLSLKDWSEVSNSQKILSGKISEAHLPYILSYNNFINFFWYDNQKDNFQNVFAYLNHDDELTGVRLFNPETGRTVFSIPVLFKNKPVFFWIQKADAGKTVFYMKTDSSVEVPDVVVKGIGNYKGENISNKNSLSFEWNTPKDISGITGFRYILTKDTNEKITDREPFITGKNSFTANNLIDGTIYFKIKAYDVAGNVSDEGIYKLQVLTISPDSPSFIDNNIDKDNNFLTNSPKITWDNPENKLVSYKLYYKLITDTSKNPKTIENPASCSVISTTETEKVFNENFDNGYFLTGIQGFDKAGNASDINWKTYNLTHYVVKTVINNIEVNIGQSGDRFLRISGRGFNVEGNITKIIIDKDGVAPYDYEISEKNFVIDSDTVLRQIKSIYIEDGAYHIGLEHTVRGVYFDPSILHFSSEWVFKYERIEKFTLTNLLFQFREINATFMILILLGIFLILIILVLFTGALKALQEKAYIKSLLNDLNKVKTEMATDEFYKRREILMKKGMGLTLKYTILILLLVITVVTSTALVISILAIKNEKINLANEMKEKALIIINNYSATVNDIYYLNKGYTEAIDTTNLAAGYQDVGFVMLNTVEGKKIVFGKYKNVFSGGKNTSDTDLSKIIEKIVYNDKNISDIDNLKKLMKSEVLIYPSFDPVNLKNNYVFVKPIITADNRYIGEVSIGFSFERILKLIQDGSNRLFGITLGVTGVAILISIIGAIFLASTTIRPIRRMSKHVGLITAKEDYEELVAEGNDKIIITSQDEIGILAASINDMTHKLIEKAKADKQLLLGKEIQKKFITLEPINNDDIDIFGFYEGAKGVSGDYFEYKKIDNDHYSFIICDVSGKAVPAALIMVQISTIFHSYFANYKVNKANIDTVSIVSSINDTIEERGFQGRFAATLVCIFNVRTGVMYLTNAGYTQLLVYRAKDMKSESIKLFSSGAAGVFPSFMLPEPFKQEKIQIGHGDIIFLFTDGIEESRSGRMTKNENGEEQFEEFGNERLQKVINDFNGKSPKEFIDKIMSTEREFRGDTEQYDDLTILGIKRK